MKRLLAAIALLAVTGFGCAPAPSGPRPLDPDWTRYESSEYGFTFGYPSNMELNQRDAENRPTQYLGVDADFFISLRDTVKDVKPTNVAFFYAVPGLTVDAFSASLVASSADGAVKVISTSETEVNGLVLTKIVSTTEMGTEKTHYLYVHDGNTVIVSVFLYEEESWEPVMQTMSAL